MSNTQGPQGAIGPTTIYQQPKGSNGPAGPEPSILSIEANSKEILRITADGNVLWFGKPSQSANVLNNLLCNLIDEKIKPGMRQRTYVRACQSILTKARTMEKSELINFLEKSIENRKNCEIMLLLRDDNEGEC
jgi:hypothetical protein